MCHLAPRGVPILDQWRGLDTAGQLDQDIDYGCKIKTPAQKIFLCRFSGLLSGEVPPFLAVCSQGIRVKAVLTTTDMHQLNPDKCRATSVDKHGMSMVLSHKCLQHFKLAPKPTEQKARFFFALFSRLGVGSSLWSPFPRSHIHWWICQGSSPLQTGASEPPLDCLSPVPCLKPVQHLWLLSSVSWGCSQCEV